MSLKSIGSNCLAPMSGLVVMFLMLLYSNTCKGQDEMSAELGPRISGGADASKGRFPYMCSIRKRGGGRHICGGTLIDKQWVMTAAHCLDPDDPNSAGMSPFLFCGIYEREEQEASKRFTPSRCYLHHLWGGNVRNGDDIALCRLDRSVSADVDIPELVNFGHMSTQDDPFDVLGWGYTGPNSGRATVLQIGSRLDLIPRDTCNTTGNWVTIIKESMICVGGRSRDTCEGDSGGPLLIRSDPVSQTIPENPQLDLIVGITSFGVEGCTAEAPGVYTRISCYRPWINCIMEGTEQDCSVYSPCGEDSSSSSVGASSLCSGIQKSATFDESDALERMTRDIVSDDSETVKKLLCDGLSPNAVYDRFSNSLLHRAAQYDAVESAKVLLEHEAEIEYKNSFGQAALSRAARYGSAAVAKLLIQNGADIESRTYEGSTPLYIAAQWNSLDVARLLTENGANIESKQEIGFTALHIAAEKNSLEVAELLIQNGADTENGSNEGSTPLYIAAKWNSLDVARLLIRNGAGIESRQENGFTALHIAAEKNSLGVAELLVENGANIESKQEIGFTALHIAAEKNSLEVAELLVRNGADTENGSNEGSTPLYIAAQWNSLDVAKLLTENGANIESKQEIGFTALHIAAEKNSLEVAELLIRNGADTENGSNEGSTPLHVAASSGHISIVRSLLRNEASKTKTDDDGKTPFGVICTNEFLDEPCKADVIATLQELLRA